MEGLSRYLTVEAGWSWKLLILFAIVTALAALAQLTEGLEMTEGATAAAVTTRGTDPGLVPGTTGTSGESSLYIYE